MTDQPHAARPDDAGLLAGLEQAPVEAREQLLAAIDDLERAAGPLVEWRGRQPDAQGVRQMPFPAYHPAVGELQQALARVNGVPVFD